MKWGLLGPETLVSQRRVRTLGLPRRRWDRLDHIWFLSAGSESLWRSLRLLGRLDIPLQSADFLRLEAWPIDPATDRGLREQCGGFANLA